MVEEKNIPTGAVVITSGVLGAFVGVTLGGGIGGGLASGLLAALFGHALASATPKPPEYGPHQ